MDVCTNCAAPAADVYCAKCGEKQPDHHDLTLGHFTHNLVHELVHLDSKLFRTLRELVARPGHLTAEYFAGRKTRYITPLRLFLTLFALQFLAYSVYQPAAIYSVRTMSKFDQSGKFTQVIERKAQKHGMTPAQYEDKLDQAWRKNISLLQLVNILGIALVLKAAYRRRHFVEHLVFSAHVLSFSYLWMLAIWPLYALLGFQPGAAHRALVAATIAVALVYLYVAQRRFYEQSRAKTAVKTAVVWVFGRWAVQALILVTSLMVALLQYR